VAVIVATVIAIATAIAVVVRGGTLAHILLDHSPDCRSARWAFPVLVLVPERVPELGVEVLELELVLARVDLWDSAVAYLLSHLHSPVFLPVGSVVEILPLPLLPQ
jgi:hypothetical protein